MCDHPTYLAWAVEQHDGKEKVHGHLDPGERQGHQQKHVQTLQSELWRSYSLHKSKESILLFISRAFAFQFEIEEEKHYNFAEEWRIAYQSS